MDAPPELRSAANKQQDIAIAHREYDDENVIVIDFGPGVDLALDIVGDTAIVVAGDQQYEFEIPAAAADISVNDGVLEITEE